MLKRLGVVAVAAALSVSGPVAIAAGQPSGATSRYIVEINGSDVLAPLNSALSAVGAKPTAVLDRVKMATADLSPAQADALRKAPGVKAVAQERPVNAAAVQSGPPWDLDRLDQRDLPLDSSYTFNFTGAGVRAYVLDTGIYGAHSDFGGRVEAGYDVLSPSASQANLDPACTTGGVSGHGTSVAGLLGGNTYGVAKQVTLVPVRVLQPCGSGSDADVITGINWAINDAQAHNGTPAVMNLSIEGTGGIDTYLEAAIQTATQANITVVVAAGNTASGAPGPVDACTISPAHSPYAVVAGALAPNDAMAYFSNYGSCLTILAPGYNNSTDTNTGGATGSFSGTSAAAPLVAGAAAQLLQRAPGMLPADVKNSLAVNGDLGRATNLPSGTPNRILNTLSTTSYWPPNVLPATQGLTAGQYLKSPNGQYELLMQLDGNLVEYNSSGTAIWSTGTYGRAGSYLLMQPDGNLVEYDGTNTPYFASGTYQAVAGNYLVLQNDGNFVVFSQGQLPLWAKSGGRLTTPDTLPNGWSLNAGMSLWSGDSNYHLVMQYDGNLVEYDAGSNVVWTSGTTGAGNYALMQQDGNFVVYTAGGNPLWATGTYTPVTGNYFTIGGDSNMFVFSKGHLAQWTKTNGHITNPDTLQPGATLSPGQALWSTNNVDQLVIQPDGNFVEYGANGSVIWANGSYGHPGSYVIMQTDGNLVEYSPYGEALWSSGTYGQAGNRLILQPDGNMVIWHWNGTFAWQR